MPKYRVFGDVTQQLFAEVEAESLEEANDKAVETALDWQPFPNYSSPGMEFREDLTEEVLA